MVFTGKPSKGCLPCREKRTKCDLAQPSCTQCLKKKRICIGYRKEQDVLFKNQTSLVVQRVQQKESRDKLEQSSSDEAKQRRLERPPGDASFDDEATLNFHSHFNDKFFGSNENTLGPDFDYLLPLCTDIPKSGEPVHEAIRAAALAALGSMTGSSELLTAARVGKGKVLRLLFRRLQNPETRLSDSSMLTCILLGALESILCDSSGSTQAMAYHLKGASALAELRGTAQRDRGICKSIYERIRPLIIAHCLQSREALPDFTLTYLEQDGVILRDANPECFMLLERLCRLRAEHKKKGYVDAQMAEEAQFLRREWHSWDAHLADWVPGRRPPARLLEKHRELKTYHFVLMSSLWVFKLVCSILSSEVVVEWFRSIVHQSDPLDPAAAAAAALEDAESAQTRTCKELRDDFDYYMETFKAADSAMRLVGSYSLVWPIYVLSNSPSFASAESRSWISDKAEAIAEEFGLRHGNIWTLTDMYQRTTLEANPPADA